MRVAADGEADGGAFEAAGLAAADTGLVVPGMAGVIASGKVHTDPSALALAQVSTGTHPMSF